MNLTEPLIGLGGKLRSGKDTLADFLVAKHGYVKLGMSEALHEAMMALDPIVGEGRSRHEPIRYSSVVETLGYTRAKELPEVRRLLQNMGTEVGRNMIGENVWVGIMARKIDDHRGAGHPVVVSGIRFPNELDMIRELNGWTVWVERDVTSNTLTTATHASESSVRPELFDIVVENNSTLEVLEGQATTLAESVAVIGEFE